MLKKSNRCDIRRLVRIKLFLKRVLSNEGLSVYLTGKL